MLTAGPEVARLPDSRGLRCLRALLAVPGREISSLDLAAGGAGLREARPEPSLDTAARDAYRRRLRELEAELDRADSAGDPLLAQRTEDERQVAAGRTAARQRIGRPAASAGRGGRASTRQCHTHAALCGGSHRIGGAARRSAPGVLDPYRPGLPLRTGAGRSDPLARVRANESFAAVVRLQGEHHPRRNSWIPPHTLSPQPDGSAASPPTTTAEMTTARRSCCCTA